MINPNFFLHTEGGGFNPIKVKNPLAVEFIIIDLFCGAGGTSTGFHRAFINGDQIAVVAACINHDQKAIESHLMNHRDTLHFIEDIRTVDLQPLVELLAKYRILYPNAKVILWASLECTNFSKAKGGQPRDADSRTLADHLDRYVIALDPDYIQIENVVEFMSWGPLISKTVKHEDGAISCPMEWKLIDVPVLGIDGFPIIQSVNENPDELEIRTKKEWKLLWQAVPESKKSGKDFIRWCKHIDSFGYRHEWREMNSADYGAYTSRNRLFGCFAKPGLPIVWPEATHAKNPISNSLFGGQEKWKAVKDVLDFEDEGVSILNRKKPLVDASLERIYAGLIKFVAGGQDSFNLHYNSTGKNGDKKQSVSSTESPYRVLTTQNRAGLVFITKYYGTGENISCIDEPAGTITTKDRFTKVQPVFLDKTYTGNGNIASITGPAGTVMPNDKHRLIYCQPFILNPSHGGFCTGTDVPCVVIIARQDKAPLYLIQFDVDPNVNIPVYDDDSEVMIRIKRFMAMYGLADIKMRMLKVSELLPIQGFPVDYKLAGNQTDQKKFIGNSVVPHVVTSWCLAMAKKCRNLRIAA